MVTCQKCKRSFPSKIKVDGKVRNFQHRKYCLDCSPFGDHNTQKLESVIQYVVDGKKLCVACNEEKSIGDFYTQSNGKKRPRKYCKDCFNNQAVGRQRKFKVKCVGYKGGKCELCGYNRCVSALEFHHRVPEEKDFQLSKCKLRIFDDVVKKELDKCILLCANCHREEHDKLNGPIE